MPPTAPLTPVASLIDRAFSRFGKVFSTIFPWLVLVCIGGILVAYGQYSSVIWQEWVFIVVGIIMVLGSFLAAARIIAETEKDPKDILGGGARTFAIFFPYIWLAILQSFIIFAGGIMVVIPSVIFGVYLSIILFVFLVEGKRGMAALTRSWGYVAGRWWEVFWRLLVLLFLLIVVTVVIGIILGLAFTAVSTGIAGTGAAFPWGLTLVQQLLESFIIAPWALCFLFELYSDLRATKPAPAVADEKTARLWLVIFLIIGIILALLLAFRSFVHTASGGSREEYGAHFYGRWNADTGNDSGTLSS